MRATALRCKVIRVKLNIPRGCGETLLFQLSCPMGLWAIAVMGAYSVSEAAEQSPPPPAPAVESIVVSSEKLPARRCAWFWLRNHRWSVNIVVVKRQFIALIVILAIGLQGSVVAFAGISPLMSTDCQTAATSHSDASQDSCCPKGQHSMSCCLEACAGTVAGAVTAIPKVLNWLGSATLLPQSRSTHFSSRGDSPLIRPPIL
jgi:hypothetical protein